MPEIIGIDHIYIAVSDLAASEKYYDAVMGVFGFRKNTFAIGGDQHIQYYNRHFGYVLRPARSKLAHDPYSAGLHHFCFRVEGEAEVREAVQLLKAAQIAVSEVEHHGEYAADYFAAFFSDPDGLRLEVTNYRAERRQRHDEWESLAGA